MTLARSSGSYEPFRPSVEPGWKEYICCKECGLIMGGPPGREAPQIWAGTNQDASCAECGASGMGNLFHCDEMERAFAAAGLPIPESLPLPAGFGDPDEWHIPERVRVCLGNSRRTEAGGRGLSSAEGPINDLDPSGQAQAAPESQSPIAGV